MTIKTLMASVFMVGTLLSCMDQTPEETIDSFTVQVVLPEVQGDSLYYFAIQRLSFKAYANQQVMLMSNRLSYKAITDSLGKAVFQHIVPGIYSLSTNMKLGDTEISLTGDTMQYSLFQRDSMVLRLRKSIKENLIISKVYASGTKDNNGKNYLADQYIEVFNNSDEVQYLDSTLYLGLVEAESVIAFPAATNPGFVFARQIFRFNVKDTNFAVAPGASVIIANSAIDHTAFSPNTVNLQQADFEVKSTKFSNNPSVRDMELIYSTFPSLIYMNLINGGDNGAFLFKTTANVREFPILYIPGKETGNRYIRVPIELVFDGVETLKNYVTTGPKPNAKRLQNFVDAGFGFINASTGYTHESVERRVDPSKPSTNRFYLIDTNNSSNNFRTVTDPTPRKYDKPLLTAE